MKNNNLNIVEFISWLHNQGINISTNGEKLFYDAPKGIVNNAIRQEIAGRKAEIMKFLQQVGQVSQTTLTPIQAIPRNENLPLSFPQERLWFIDQLEGSKAPYIESGALQITGDLNVLVLQKALSSIVDRHEVLRTSFPTIDGTPVQVIDTEGTIEIKIVDLQQLETKERETEVITQAQIEATTPFDLENGPLIRCSLLELSPSEYVLLLTMHHIISDGWSMRVFIQELSNLYRAFIQGQESPLKELPIQYADFAVWQRQYLSGEVLSNQLDYWKQQLNGAPDLLQLPTDFPRPTVQTYQGNSISFTLNTELTTKLQNLSRSCGTTLFMTLYAAFSTLLHRYSGQSDIVVGTPIANRNRSEIEGLIGFFVNTLVLRSNFENNPSFPELLAQVRETTLKAYEYQDVPFEQVVEALQPQRSLSYSPLFQVMFNMLNLEEIQLELPGVKLELLDIMETTTSKFDLILYAAEKNHEIELKLAYNSDLFTAERMVVLLNQFHHLLEQIVTAPDNPISSYSLVTPESKPLLPEPSEVLPESEYELVTAMLENWANRTPEKPAIHQGSKTWNYHQLCQTAQTLAKVLIAHGIKGGEVVAVSGIRSFGFIASMIGVFLSGGILLTIEPKLPKHRQQIMLQQAKAKYILYVSDQSPEQQSIWDSLVNIYVEPETGEAINSLHDASQVKCLPKIASDDAAYIFFTSGTTGIPKGVLGCHKGISHFLTWQCQTFEIGQHDRVAQLTGLSFDVVLRDIFLPLISGATLCLPQEEDILQPELILSWLEREQISVVHTVPTLGQYWLRDVPMEVSLSSLRWLFLAGEPLQGTVVKQWHETFPQSAVKIVNLYGPTETTLAKCFYQVPLECTSGIQSIGLPLPQTQALILGLNSQLCGIGEEGEIVIRTPFRSLGYINSEEENKEKFGKNPFRNDEEDIFYYTGDRGRYNLDGSLSILGRRDHQVKIRGVRIELGEIETILSQHPTVVQNVVIAREDVKGNKILVAYVVANSEIVPTHGEIQQFLLSKLPDYMVPSAFVTLDSLPLTPNGKIDRQALPAPDITKRETEYVAPRTQTEEIIANMFSDVLGVEKIGINDNFFELGGHSLLATQLISRIRESLAIEIPLRELFSAPTVVSLEQTIIQLRNSNQGLSLPTIQQRGETEQLPLSWAQERLWFLNQLEGQSATYNIPTAVRINGELDINALQTAISEIVDRHEVLKTSFQTVNGKPIQVINTEATIDINLIDLQQLETRERETEVLTIAQVEATNPFDLENGPLIRCSLLQLSPSEYVLLLTMHHIISDGWSMGVFIRELSTLYQAFIQGQESALGELSIQYADFAVWQRQYLSGEVLSAQLDYWKQQLNDAPDLLQLPTDFPRPKVQNYQGNSISFTLNIELTTKLQNLARESGATLFMTLHVAFSTLLQRYSGQSDIVVGTPIANRNRREIEGLIGFFVNTLVLRTNFENNPSFPELLAQVRETTLKAYEHQDVPFEQVVEALQPQRSLSHSPLFQVMFILQNAPMGEVKSPGITLSPIELESTIAKFDLTLSMRETEQGLVGEWEYNTDLFKGETIERMVAHFQNLLEVIVENPQESVGSLTLLSEWERHQLLVEWNDTATEYPKDKCIHFLFEQQVEKTPNAIAVVFEDEQLTYEQLNERANQLANYLQSLGVKPEVLVGICVERSVEMVVGLLGILKAGGAYVPLDPNYPPERLSYMLDDSGVGVLVTHSELLEFIPEHNAEVVCLDSDWSAIESHSLENINVGVGVLNLAYVIYTSGSTGQPKGVLVEHQALVNHMCWMQSCFPLEENDKVIQKTPFSFDASVWEFYAPLFVGAQLVIAKPGGHKNSNYLVDEISRLKITTIQVVPSLLRMLLETPGIEKCQSLKRVFCGGEILPVEVVEDFKKKLNAQLNNIYGPSEATIDTTFFKCEEKFDQLTIPIGRPIANTQIYILDSHRQPVPVGIAGELYIGGDGLARGYLNRPQLTSEKFVPNPFNSTSKLYKTGDLARYLSDGNIEFLDRIDNQVKIRGFRIELGEIEAVLAIHPQINQTVVIATEENTGNKRLVAYIVAEKEITTAQLREYLKAQLPEYMVPSAFVTLDSLPLTPNGKIDRKALPAPEIERETEYVAPRRPTEEIIANIFSDVLGVEKIGINDNFFELGGHSLLATQLISRIREALDIEIPLRELFSAPTVASLDQTITQLRNSNDETPSQISLPTIIPTPEEKTQPFPLTDIQQAYWLGRNQNFDLGNIATHGYIEIDCSNLHLPQLNQAWQKLIEHHDMLRAIVLADGEQKILEEIPSYSIEILDLSSGSESEITQELETIRTQMSHEILPAEQWPLFKIRATILDEKRTRLHLSFDAIIADAWSMMLLGQQWQQLYENPQTILPPLEISFRDYVVTELSLKDTPKYKQAQEYWFNRHLPPAPQLPFATHPSSISKPTFKRHSARLEAIQWQQLKQRATKANLTPSALLLAVFADILNYWSKTPNFTINLTLFNRWPLHPQVNQLVGDFTSLTLLEVDNSSITSFTARAQRLQQQLWQDLDHNYVSGVEVQRELRRVNSNTQSMGVVFTSTLGLNSLIEDSSSLNHLGEVVYAISQTPQVWLDHKILEEDGALVFNWDVVEELFPSGLMEDMFASYCNWLEQLANTEDAWLETHPQLLPAQQHSTIVAVNDTNTDFVEETLHSLFHKQVAGRSQFPAVISPQKTLTYEELHQKASNLAQQLRQLGATPNSLVAVIMEKGWEQIVAVLGILMSGAAYLPISAEFPPFRQQYLLEQGKVKLVITQPQLEQTLSIPEGIECLVVTQEELPSAVSHPFESRQTPEDLAYVIYTSGSTGQPKGVMIDHKGAVNTILDINKRFGVGIDDRVLAVSALEFDLSVYDIFGILAAGGAIVIPEPEPYQRKNPAHWLELINAHQVTIWNTVPALMQMLVEHLFVRRNEQVGNLRLALLSGDWLPVNLPEQIKSLSSQIEVISLGGATEASIWSIFHPIDKVESHCGSIPYGKPLDNQRFYVLNKLMQPTPTWVEGELYIGGIGLAKGYWQDEAKTNNSFITHPITQERLYKTGDLGRYLPSGEIEFLGREDFQVKINGFRIELGEIETVLKEHSAVKEAVVSSHNNQLVAYVVPQLQGENNSINSPEASTPEQLSGVVINPIERLEFKLKQPGLRQFSEAESTIDLPLSEIDKIKSKAYFQRQSYRQFLHEPITLEDFSEFLSCLLQKKLDDFPLPKYRYPSAGNLYPVQTYLLIKPNRIEGLSPGIYYYHPGEHNLRLINTIKGINSDIYGGNKSIFEQSAFSIFLMGKISAIAPMYGELARDFCLLEAGHIGQLLMENAHKKEIGLCPIGKVEFGQIREKLELESNQPLLYSFVGGKIDLAQTLQISSSEVGGGKKSILTQMHEYLKQKLPNYMVPSECLILESLPLTANGKIDRQALPAPDITERETVYIPPRTQTELQLTQIWSSVLNIPQVGVKDNFFQLGGHSLLAVRLMSQIQKQFQINLPLATLFQSSTIEQLALSLGSKVSLQLWSTLVPIQPNGLLPPLFCVPGVGGNVLYFHNLGKYLGNNQPLYGLQAQGLDGETEPLHSVEEIAQHNIKAIQTVQSTGPYFLAGHSFGGRVAFEMANQLQRMGESVAYVGILDISAPIESVNHQDDYSNRDDAQMLCLMAEGIEELGFKNLVLDYQTLAALSEEQQLYYFKEKLEMVGVLPPQTDIKVVRGLVQVSQTQSQIKYKPENIYSAPITLFRAKEVNQEQQNSSTLSGVPTWGWDQFSDGSVEVHIVPGNHHSMMSEPHVKVLGEKLEKTLEQAHKRTPEK